MRFTTTGAAAALLLASMAPAMAQAPAPMMMGTAWDAWQGFYAGVNVGAGWGSASGSLTPNVCLLTAGCGAVGPVTLSSHINYSGPLGGVQGGYNWHFAPSWLLGVETDFDGAGVTAHSSSQSATFPAPVGTVTYNVSGGQDYLGTVRGRLGWIATPDLLFYGTGGFAYGEVHTSAAASVAAPALSFVGTTSGVKTGWAAGGGIEYAFAPQWSLRGEYLHVDLGSSSITAHLVGTAPAGITPGVGYTTSINTSEDIIRVGVNYHFGAPPPPPPAPAAMPAPPPAAPKVFIVFFDWDKDVITPEGEQIIQQAADAYKSGAPVQLQVTGYTDRSGSPGYNQRLSERRANNVAKALAALGVPKSQMVVSGRGENDNRVPTAPGVREPQNRRVEIVAP